jgi:hypothetical protein
VLDLFIEAQKQMYSREVIYNDSSYIVYKQNKDQSLYIHMIYTKLDKRKSGSGNELLQELIAITKPTALLGYVDLTTNNPELSISTHLHYGAKIIKSSPESLVFYKELK